ncbi:hypothetical protein Tco_1467835 [Tanacetum coccineum]
MMMFMARFGDYLKKTFDYYLFAEKSLKKKDQLKLDEDMALKLQVGIDEEERLAREKDEANVALTEEWDDI